MSQEIPTPPRTSILKKISSAKNMAISMSKNELKHQKIDNLRSILKMKKTSKNDFETEMTKPKMIQQEEYFNEKRVDALNATSIDKTTTTTTAIETALNKTTTSTKTTLNGLIVPVMDRNQKRAEEELMIDDVDVDDVVDVVVDVVDDVVDVDDVDDVVVVGDDDDVDDVAVDDDGGVVDEKQQLNDSNLHKMVLGETEMEMEENADTIADQRKQVDVMKQAASISLDRNADAEMEIAELLRTQEIQKETLAKTLGELEEMKTKLANHKEVASEVLEILKERDDRINMLEQLLSKRQVEDNIFMDHLTTLIHTRSSHLTSEKDIIDNLSVTAAQTLMKRRGTTLSSVSGNESALCSTEESETFEENIRESTTSLQKLRSGPTTKSNSKLHLVYYL